MSENKGRKQISTIQMKPEMKIKTVDDQALERIHQATLSILQQAGVRFPSAKALKIFAAAGADVDRGNGIVKIQADLLMEALSRAPRHFVMGSRGDPGLDILLDGTKTFCGTAGTGTATVDLKTRKRRASTKKDVAMMARIADFLPSISFYWPMVAAQDCPSAVLPLHEIEAAFTNTEKHVHIVSCADEKTARYAVEMAAAVAENKKTMMTRPPLSLIASPISPLCQDEGPLDAALVFAEAGLPVCFAAMPVIGSTAPASIPAALAMGNAEILSAACLIQLACPGAPLAYPLFSAMMNPYTGGCLVSTKMQFLFYAATVQLGHYYNLPVMSTFGGSDINKPGSWQAGRDDALDAFFICATGPDMLPCLGLMEAYMLLYPEKLLLDDEIFQSVKYMAAGLRVDAEMLAIDEIMAVGPGGHFLDREYTVANIRKIWPSGICRQWSSSRQDFKDPQVAAVEKARWILDNHKPKRLNEATARELDKIIRRAEKELLD